MAIGALQRWMSGNLNLYTVLIVGRSKKMETKLVMWTCVAMAVMLSIVYFSLSFIASIVH
jgi:hypothetical protein